ncbi:MAG: cytochrome C oxidase subunit IV family protein [Planctomycetota bacterium]|jgi:cytochrome c oxidase subunit 4
MAEHPTEHGEHGSHGVGHVVPIHILVATCLGLLVLTFITVFVAGIDFSEYQMAELNVIVALAIAVIKGSLVCLFFMHLRWDRPFNAFVLVASLSFVALFIGFAITDTFEYGPEVEQYERTELQGEEVPLVQQKLNELATEAPAEP